MYVLVGHKKYIQQWFKNFVANLVAKLVPLWLNSCFFLKTPILSTIFNPYQDHIKVV